MKSEVISIRLDGREMASCLTTLVPLFIWRILGAEISSDEADLINLQIRNHDLIEQMKKGLNLD